METSLPLRSSSRSRRKGQPKKLTIVKLGGVTALVRHYKQLQLKKQQRVVKQRLSRYKRLAARRLQRTKQDRETRPRRREQLPRQSKADQKKRSDSAVSARLGAFTGFPSPAARSASLTNTADQNPNLKVSDPKEVKVDEHEEEEDVKMEDDISCPSSPLLACARLPGTLRPNPAAPWPPADAQEWLSWWRYCQCTVANFTRALDMGWQTEEQALAVFKESMSNLRVDNLLLILRPDTFLPVPGFIGAVVDRFMYNIDSLVEMLRSYGSGVCAAPLYEYLVSIFSRRWAGKDFKRAAVAVPHLRRLNAILHEKKAPLVHPMFKASNAVRQCAHSFVDALRAPQQVDGKWPDLQEYPASVLTVADFLVNDLVKLGYRTQSCPKTDEDMTAWRAFLKQMLH